MNRDDQRCVAAVRELIRISEELSQPDVQFTGEYLQTLDTALEEIKKEMDRQNRALRAQKLGMRLLKAR